jgi:flagellar hook assembly protein FlgD
VVDCKDVNGNANSREIQFIVNDKFDIINIGNYPNPVLGRAQDPKNDGRTRFTYVLTDQADEVSIKVYTVAGRLVKSFKNLPTGVGYHEFPRTLYGWDCKDEANIALANGVYFYKVRAVKGNKRIEKTMKMAILK